MEITIKAAGSYVIAKKVELAGQKMICLFHNGDVITLEEETACELGAWLFNNCCATKSDNTSGAVMPGERLADEFEPCSCGKVMLKTRNEAVSVHGHIHSFKLCSQ